MIKEINYGYLNCTQLYERPFLFLQYVLCTFWTQRYAKYSMHLIAAKNSRFLAWKVNVLQDDHKKLTKSPSNGHCKTGIFFREHELYHRYFIQILRCSQICRYIHKVHIFWEGHKILPNLHCSFDWWRFRKILWPSQNIWALKVRNDFNPFVNHKPF